MDHLDVKHDIARMLARKLSVVEIAAELRIDVATMEMIAGSKEIQDLKDQYVEFTEEQNNRVVKYGNEVLNVDKNDFHAQLDKTVDETEYQTLLKLRQMLIACTKPTDLAKIYAALNSAKRKKDPVVANVQQFNTLAVLNIPPALKKQFQIHTDQNNQVYQINDTVMTAKDPEALVLEAGGINLRRNAGKLVELGTDKSIPLIGDLLNETTISDDDNTLITMFE